MFLPGDALVNFTLNATGDNHPTLYLFLNEDWIDVEEEDNCDDKLARAKGICKSVLLPRAKGICKSVLL